MVRDDRCALMRDSCPPLSLNCSNSSSNYGVCDVSKVRLLTTDSLYTPNNAPGPGSEPRSAA